MHTKPRGHGPIGTDGKIKPPDSSVAQSAQLGRHEDQAAGRDQGVRGAQALARREDQAT
jgi:hypothetical protein